MSLGLARTRDTSTESVFNKDFDASAMNQRFIGSKPSEIMKFTVEHAVNPVIFTNFRPLAVAFLHLVTQPLKAVSYTHLTLPTICSV